MRKGILVLLIRRLWFAAFAFAMCLAGRGSSLVVTTADETGPGSLRDAIVSSEVNSSITFAPELAGATIELAAGPLLVAKSVIIDGSMLSPRLAISGRGESRVFRIEAEAVVTLKGLRIENGDSGETSFEESGGAIYNLGELTLVNCELRNSRSVVSGGAICNDGSKALRVFNCVISGNQAHGGGGIYSRQPVHIYDSTFDSNTALYGGGVFGDVFLYNCRFSGNGSLITTSGGALWAWQAEVDNCTFTRNRADDGAAIESSRLLVVRGSTFYDNAQRDPWNVVSILAEIARIENCTIAGEDVFVREPSTILNSTIVGGLGGRRELRMTNCVVSSVFGPVLGANNRIDPSGAQLLPLGDYGGPTATMPPRMGSPLIDAGNSEAPPTDQRGFRRSGVADIGAAEFGGSPIAAPVLAVDSISQGTFRVRFGSVPNLRFMVRGAAEVPSAEWLAVGLALETPAGSGEYVFESDPLVAPEMFFKAAFP